MSVQSHIRLFFLINLLDLKKKNLAELKLANLFRLCSTNDTKHE
jgi:hypothetical protein